MSEFVDHLAELFGEFGPVTIRRRFACMALFANGCTGQLRERRPMTC